MLYFPKLKKETIETFVSFQDYNYIYQAISKGKGQFFLSGHISNWELMAFSYAKIFRSRLNVVVKPQTNKGINKTINKYREMCGNEMLEIGGSLRNIYTLIKKNETVCFLLDQSANPDYSVYADFFGQKVATFSGPAKIALKNRTEIIFAYAYRSKTNKYMIVTEPLKYDDLTGGATDENVQILTERFNKALERVIREHPDQWLWLHRRFKHVQK